MRERERERGRERERERERTRPDQTRPGQARPGRARPEPMRQSDGGGEGKPSRMWIRVRRRTPAANNRCSHFGVERIDRHRLWLVARCLWLVARQMCVGPDAIKIAPRDSEKQHFGEIPSFVVRASWLVTRRKNRPDIEKNQ